MRRIVFFCYVACLVATLVAVMIGRTMMPHNLLTFTSSTGMGYTVYVVDVNRHLTVSLPDSYSLYQHYYGWSDDGNFAFVSDRDDNIEVYLWDWQTMTNISQHAFNDWRPAISRDGRVAFASERDGNMEIYIWDEGTLTNVSQDALTDDYPTWSDDGRLAWLSDRTGDFEIVVWDGVNIVNVSQSPTTTEIRLKWGAGPLTWFRRNDETGAISFQMWAETQRENEPRFPLIPNGFAWNGDGRLAYIDTSDIYVWDGNAIFNITGGIFTSGSNPVWLSDGRLAFVSFMGGNNPEVFIWDGATVQRLTYNDLSEVELIWTW